MRRPLAGRTVVVTRPAASSAGLTAALRARGARVVHAPLIRIAPPRSWRPLDAALRRLGAYDAVAFASVNAVERFFSRTRRAPKAPGAVGAVGPATARALTARGWRPTAVAAEHRAAGLAAALRLPKGARVLLPRAERGREELPRLLAASGARVDAVSVYRTLADHAGRRALRRARPDAVCFASGSAAASAAAALGRARLRTAFASVAIGPTTAAALRKLGARVTVSGGTDDAAFAKAVVAALGAGR